MSPEAGIVHFSGLHCTLIAAAGHFALEVEIFPGDEIHLTPGQEKAKTGHYDDGKMHSHNALSLVFCPDTRALS